MGKCDNCGKKILYNKYKRYRKQILCPECYATRLERKAAKKAELKRKAEELKIVTPTKKAKKDMKDKGITGDFVPSDLDGHALDADDMKAKEDDDDAGKTAEDSR